MKQTKSFNWGELLIPGIALVFGIAFLSQTFSGPINAMRWPYAIVILTVVFLALILWKFVFRQTTTEASSQNTPKDYRKDLIILIAPIVYVFVMQYIGFALASVIFLALMFRLLGSKSWLATFGVALLMTTVLYVAMIILMQMPLPQLTIGTFTL